MCCLFIVMVENADGDPVERQNLFLSIISEMSHRQRLKLNQILMELPSMLKFHYMLTSVSSHLIPTKLRRLNFFLLKKLNGKIGMTCLIGYIVKQIKWDLKLLYVDPI